MKAVRHSRAAASRIKVGSVRGIAFCLCMAGGKEEGKERKRYREVSI